MTAIRSNNGMRTVDSREPAPEHVVHFYDEDEALLQNAASFLAGGLLRGAPALVISAPARAEGLQLRLTEMGVDLGRAIAARQLVLLDSETTVDALLVDDAPDEAAFRAVIGAQVLALSELWRPFRLLAFGDMVDVLAARGNTNGSIELERMWDDLAHRHGFALYCAYEAKRFALDADRAAFDAICRHHNLIVPMNPLPGSGGSQIPAI